MRLTDREFEVLYLWREGLTNRQIALQFGVHFHYIAKVSSRVKNKLNARDRTHAVVRAFELGILEIEKEEP